MNKIFARILLTFIIAMNARDNGSETQNCNKCSKLLLYIQFRLKRILLKDRFVHFPVDEIYV